MIKPAISIGFYLLTIITPVRRIVFLADSSYRQTLMKNKIH